MPGTPGATGSPWRTLLRTISATKSQVFLPKPKFPKLCHVPGPFCGETFLSLLTKIISATKPRVFLPQCFVLVVETVVSVLRPLGSNRRARGETGRGISPQRPADNRRASPPRGGGARPPGAAGGLLFRRHPVGHRCYRAISMLSRRSGASHCEARRLPAVVCRNSSATNVTNKRYRTCGTAAAHYAARQLPARCGGLPGRARLPRRLPLADRC